MSVWPSILVAVFGSLSVIATSVLILLYIFNKSVRTYGFRLVIQLFIYDFIFSTATTIPTISGLISSELVINDWLCYLEGGTKLFAMLASFFTTVAISWTLYTHIIRRQPIKTKSPSMHFIGYTLVLPLIMTIIPLSLDRIGHVEPLKNVMCFMCLKKTDDDSTDYTGLMLRIFIYYMPFIVVLIFDIYSAIRIIYYFHKNQIDYSEQNDVKYLLLYPIILLLSWIWIIVARITESFDNKPVVWLNYFDSALAALNGFLNAMVYGFISLDPFQFFHKNKFAKNEKDISLIQNENQYCVQSNDSMKDDQSNLCTAQSKNQFTFQYSTGDD